MNLLSKFVSGAAAETINSVGTVLDNLITNDDERAKAKAELTAIVTAHLQAITDAAKEVVMAEANGNWLQRSWRPILMLTFGYIVVYEYFIAPVFHLPPANLPDRFWNLLEIGFGGYVIGRSVEKVTDSITRNFDKLPSKRK